MILNTSDRLQPGGTFADLFVDPDRTRVHKVFVGPLHQAKGYAPNDQLRRRNTFTSECAAYGVVLQNPALIPLVPRFFERSIITDIVDEGGRSKREEYLIDCCYTVEFIQGSGAWKIGECRVAYPYVEKAERTFHDAGVLYTADCSVFCPEDEQGVKFIDFAIQEFPPNDYDRPWL